MTKRNNPLNRKYLRSLYYEFNKRKNSRNLNNFLGELGKSSLTLKSLCIPKRDRAYFKKQAQIIKRAENGNEDYMALLNKVIGKKAHLEKNTNGNSKTNNITLKMVPGTNGSFTHNRNYKRIPLYAIR